MSRTDYAGTMIGQQQGRAICRKNPNRQPGSARYESVGAWPLLLLPGLLDDDRLSRMDLIAGQQFARIDIQGARRTAPVFRDMGGVIATAEPTVEGGVDAFADASFSGEEGVAQPGDRIEGANGQHEGDPIPGSSWSKG